MVEVGLCEWWVGTAEGGGPHMLVARAAGTKGATVGLSCWEDAALQPKPEGAALAPLNPLPPRCPLLAPRLRMRCPQRVLWG